MAVLILSVPQLSYPGPGHLKGCSRGRRVMGEGTVVLLGFSEWSEPVFPGEPAAGMRLCHPRVRRAPKARQREPSARPWCPEGLGRNSAGV